MYTRISCWLETINTPSIARVATIGTNASNLGHQAYQIVKLRHILPEASQSSPLPRAKLSQRRTQSPLHAQTATQTTDLALITAPRAWVRLRSLCQTSIDISPSLCIQDSRVFPAVNSYDTADEHECHDISLKPPKSKVEAMLAIHLLCFLYKQTSTSHSSASHFPSQRHARHIIRYIPRRWRRERRARA